MDLLKKVADELRLSRVQVEGAEALLKEGASVPFIARYRKERTSGLDETKIRAIKHRLHQINELEQRRAVALKAIDESGHLTLELKTRIENAATKVELEDLYMPYRTRRRVRSAAARQKGLEGLADLIWKPFPNLDSRTRAKSADKSDTAGDPESSEHTDSATAEVAAPAADAPTASEQVETPAAAMPAAQAAPSTTEAAAPAAEAAPVETEKKPDTSVATPVAIPSTESTAGTPAPASTAATSVEELVKPFINAEKGVKDMAEALSGARDCVAERISEDAACRKIARDLFWSEGKLICKAREGVNLTKGKYAAFAQFNEPLGKVPPHRILTLMRGAAEKQLSLVIEPPREKIIQELRAQVITNPDAPLKLELTLAIEEGYDRLLAPSLDNEIRQELKRRADIDAIEVMARNLRALLLQAPFGHKAVIAAEAAADKSVRLVTLDANGKLVSHIIVTPEKGPDERKKAAEDLTKLIKDHQVKGIAVSSGTGSREVETFVREVLKSAQAEGVEGVIQAGVSEAGAPLYSAAPESREEFPEIDAATRGTIFIGRRMQDPLAQLIKIDPNSLALGPHQHETDQLLLKQRLEEVVESCANFVGADLNSAPVSFLRHIAGLNAEFAKKIVEARKTKTEFKSRQELKDVTGLTAYAFVQSSGFLRVAGDNPLDVTFIHPENYSLVDAFAASLNTTVKELLGNAELAGKLDLAKFKTADTTEQTLRDIRDELLKKPGSDPRGEFTTPGFSDEVKDIADLKPGMTLNGVVSSLTPFGAFVNIGVHQDGLVHISAITHKFIRDPSDALTLGQHVKVKVIGVEADRKRISLSMKELEPAPAPRQSRPPAQRGAGSGGQQRPPRGPRPPQRTSTGQAQHAASTPAHADSTSGAAPQSNQGPRDGRDHRPQRFDRRPRPDRSSGSPAPVGATSGATPSGTSEANAVPMPAGPRRDRFEGRRSHDHNKDKSRDGGRKDGQREAPKPPPPGQPDYSKFFVKPKRKEREDKTRRVDIGASRQEVRDLMKNENSGGTSLADLLRKAGVVADEEAK